MKLLYIVNARIPTEKAHGLQISKMCEAFALNDLEVELWTPKRIQSNSLRNTSLHEYYDIGIPFIVKFLPNYDIFRFQKYLPAGVFRLLNQTHAFLWGLFAVRSTRSHQFDLHFTRDLPIAFWLILHNLPTIYEVHAEPSNKQLGLLKLMARFNSLKIVITLSEDIKQQLIHNGFRAENILNLPHAVDLQKFTKPMETTEAREVLDLPQAKFIIGYVGRFSSSGVTKGIEQLILLTAQVKKASNTELLLLCVGGPLDRIESYKELGIEQGLSLDEMLFVDRVASSQVPLWLWAANVLILPTSEQYAKTVGATPLKLPEYMASRRPIVAFKLPTILMQLEHGRSACLVDSNDYQAMADSVIKLSREPDLCKQLADNAYVDVEKFTWENRASKILQAMD